MSVLSTSTRRSALDAFARALTRETHNLAERPTLLWQQLYNRLQWEDEPVPTVLAHARLRRDGAGDGPWLHLHTPFPESRALIRTLTGHTSEVRSCAWSPDGIYLLSGSDDRTLKLWNATTGQESVSLMGHTKHVTMEGIGACAFSPDGTFIVSASSDFTAENLLLWDTASGQVRAHLRGHNGPVYCSAFSPDGASIASGGDDRSLRIWDAYTAQLRLTITDEMRSPVAACCWTPDGATIYSAASWENIITSWDARTGHRLGTLATGHADHVTDCAVSRDGGMLVSCGDDGTIKLWELRGNHLLATFAVPYVEVLAVACSPDGTLIAAAYSDNLLRLWDVRSGQLRAALAGHTSRVHACAFNPDGTRLLSASADQTLRLWDVRHALLGESEAPATITDAPDRNVFQCLWSPDGQSLLVRLWDTLESWDSQVSQLRLSLPGKGFGIHSCAWSPDSTSIAMGCDENASDDTAARETAADASAGVHGKEQHTNVIKHAVVLWDARTGQERAVLGSHAGEIGYCGLSPDGARLVSASSDGAVKLWDATTGSLLAEWRGGTFCDWSPDGRFVASSEYENREVSLSLREVRTGRDVMISPGRTSIVHGQAFSPDGRTLLIVHERRLTLWDLATNRERAVLADDNLAPIATRTFSPDGSLVASGFGKNLIGLWNAHTGQAIATLRGHSEIVTHCAFSPDGALLISRGNDASLKLWDVQSGQLRASLPLPSSWIGLGEPVVHPVRPAVVVSSETRIYFVTLEGVTYGPLIVTARDRGGDLAVTCPVCRRTLALRARQLGSVIACPQAGCSGHLRINPFVLNVSDPAKPSRHHLWPFGKRS